MSGIQSLFRPSAIVALVVALTTCQKRADTGSTADVPYYNTPDFTPIWLSNASEADRTITHSIADFSLRNQANQVVSQETVAGKVYVANFFFTSCPTVCPKMASLLKTVQDTFRLEPTVALLSFSVTPWLDSVPQLARYARSKGIIPGKWHLLTGSRNQIYTLARQSYFAEEALGFTKDSTEFLHTEHLILVDQRRRIRGVYNGTQILEIDKLMLDIRALINK